MSLLQEATTSDTRLKMYIYGEPGTGKTVTSLHFPGVAVIDTERGTDHYAKFFKFKRIHTTDPTVAKQVIDELLENPGDVRTLVIDSFTVLYDMIMAKHESRMKIKTGNPNYSLQPMDYKVIKSEVKALVLRLLSLDMNIIVTARSAVDYSKEEFMKVQGTKAEGPKELPYLFDTVLELTNKDGQFIANTKKDRTNTLPPTFEFSYKAFTDYIGIDSLERAPVVFKQKSTLEEHFSKRSTIVNFRGNEIKTAGVNADNLAKIAELADEFGDDNLQTKLKEDFYIDSVLDLKNDEAALLIKDVLALLAQKP